jgi:hypothetical protein
MSLALDRLRGWSSSHCQESAAGGRHQDVVVPDGPAGAVVVVTGRVVVGVTGRVVVDVPEDPPPAGAAVVVVDAPDEADPPVALPG